MSSLSSKPFCLLLNSPVDLKIQGYPIGSPPRVIRRPIHLDLKSHQTRSRYTYALDSRDFGTNAVFNESFPGSFLSLLGSFLNTRNEYSSLISVSLGGFFLWTLFPTTALTSSWTSLSAVPTVPLTQSFSSVPVGVVYLCRYVTSRLCQRREYFVYVRPSPLSVIFLRLYLSHYTRCYLFSYPLGVQSDPSVPTRDTSSL